MKNSIKNYYEQEVSNIQTPPMPTFKKKKTIKPWENILLAAMSVASLVIVYNPGFYDSKIRNLEFSKERNQVLIDNLSRVVYETDLYYNKKRSCE